MRSSDTRLGIGFALGAVTAFFVDPSTGRRRRHVLRDRSLRVARRVGRLLSRKGGFFAGRARGVAAEARTAVVQTDVATDDATVKQRILSDALRDVPDSAGAIDVDVRDGVAMLRGSLGSQSLVDDLIARVREVPGVRGVTPALTVGGAGADLDQGI